MLRNLNETLPGGGRILGTPFVGLLGADILAAAGGGDYGASIFANDSMDPVKRYRALITASTFPAGTFILNENGGGQFTIGGTATIALYENNVTYGSSAFTGTIGPVAPTITTQPGAQTVTVGSTASFSVTAAGTAPLSYQWRRNGVNISGATSASYSFTTTIADNGAAYSVVVSNAGGSVTSASATLTVNGVAPSISVQPTAQSVVEGGSATFSVTATGTAPLSYQWRRNGANISGANASTYATPSTTLTGGAANNGDQYSVVVSNAAGTVTSGNAVLTVTSGLVAPSITTQPGNQAVIDGQTATFSVVASGTAPLGYQWRRNGTPISGATSSSYSVTAALADTGALFSVVVSNGAGSTTSANAALTVSALAPSITSQPQSQTVNAGQDAAFQVVATGSVPLTYQWRRNGAAIAGATSASYSFTTALSDSGATFSVTVSNAGGTVTSVGVALTVNAAASAPSISVQPQPQSVVSGNPATFTVVAAGTAPLAYQWRRNGAAIAGATASSYTLNAQTSDSGASFDVVVSNSAGTLTSAAAALTVTPEVIAPSIAVQPQPRSIAEGQSATFSVVASGTSPLVYQWRRNGVPIAGATTSSYTLALASLLDSGAVFDVVVSNGIGSATSTAVSVTVSAQGALAPYEQFLPMVLPEVPGCPDQSVIYHARQACIEFFQRTLAWRQRGPATTAVAEVSTYAIPLPPESALVKLLDYWIDGQDGKAVNKDMGDSLSEMESRADVAWTVDRVNFTVNPMPAGGEALELVLALKPTQASTGILEELFEQYADYLRDGTLARLFAMSRQPWTDKGEARVRKEAFEDAIDRVSAAAAKGFSRHIHRTKPLLF